MGFMRTCACCSTLVVALVAIFLGALFGGHLSSLGPLMNVLSPEGHQSALGLLPATIKGDWHFAYDKIPDLTGKVALVTGANSGVGYWTALHLARKGAEVHVGCRSTSKCEKAIETIKANFSAALLKPAIGDMSSLASVRSLAAAFQQSSKRLDMLVLNAGVATHPKPVTEDNIEPVFATNHVGHQLLYTLLEDLLVQTGEQHGDARVVAVSSAAHFDSYPDGVALTRSDLNARHEPVFSQGKVTRSYEQSKLANVLFAQEAASRLRRSNVYANSCHPGVVATEFMSNAKSAADPALFQSMQLQFMLWFASKIQPAMWTSEDGALTQVYLASSPDVATRDIRGRYFHPQAQEVVPHRQHCANATLQKRLWTFTEGLIAGKDV